MNAQEQQQVINRKCHYKDCHIRPTLGKMYCGRHSDRIIIKHREYMRQIYHKAKQYNSIIQQQEKRSKSVEIKKEQDSRYLDFVIGQMWQELKKYNPDWIKHTDTYSYETYQKMLGQN